MSQSYHGHSAFFSKLLLFVFTFCIKLFSIQGSKRKTKPQKNIVAFITIPCKSTLRKGPSKIIGLMAFTYAALRSAYVTFTCSVWIQRHCLSASHHAGFLSFGTHNTFSVFQLPVHAQAFLFRITNVAT
ncbi:hypothetical protein BX600DRAFT_177976 [Xylariales sp. PMI_506]|nr:hypothetical protein BX600DRAFT_177976 [Xylariales sp. PMI_506]